MHSAPLSYLPGPTAVPPSVLAARSAPVLDGRGLYERVSDKIKSALHTRSSVHVLAGEGMLALDAACCSLIEPSDCVLIIANGVFGGGFHDLVDKYTQKYTIFQPSDKCAVSPADLELFILERKRVGEQFTIATLVHCDTPSGVLNDIASLVPILTKHSILSIVDIVASAFGTPIDIDGCSIDIALIGSQKALSCPPGLAMLAISENAWRKMEERTTPIPSYYCNLLLFRHAPDHFAYTMPFQDIAGLDESLRLLCEEGLENVYQRHALIAEAVRAAVTASGLQLYLSADYSPTVTAFVTPCETTVDSILDVMLKDHGIQFAGSLGYLDKKVLRIGHMGFNAYPASTVYVLKALTQTLRFLGVNLKCDLGDLFFEKLHSK